MHTEPQHTKNGIKQMVAFYSVLFTQELKRKSKKRTSGRVILYRGADFSLASIFFYLSVLVTLSGAVMAYIRTATWPGETQGNYANK